MITMDTNDRDDDGLTRAGRAARRARANALKGDRQARADLEGRWSALTRHDEGRLPTVSPLTTETL
jgi:hypothetical protein